MTIGMSLCTEDVACVVAMAHKCLEEISSATSLSIIDVLVLNLVNRHNDVEQQPNLASWHRSLAMGKTKPLRHPTRPADQLRLPAALSLHAVLEHSLGSHVLYLNLRPVWATSAPTSRFGRKINSSTSMLNNLCRRRYPKPQCRSPRVRIQLHFPSGTYHRTA